MIAGPDVIINLIPQRHPMVMIGNLLECDENGSSTEFLIKDDNIFVENGFFSESGMIENIAQTAGAQIGYICKIRSIPVPVGFIGAIKNLEIFFLPKVNQTIFTRVKVDNEILGVTIITGEILIEGNTAAKTEMRIVIKK